MSDATAAKVNTVALCCPSADVPPDQCRMATRVYAGILCILIWIAWLPQCQPYLAVADDFPFGERMRNAGVIATISDAFELNGIRRSLGLHTNLPICGARPTITGFLCVGLHSVAVVTLFGFLTAAIGLPRVAFLFSLLFGVFPWGYGAITWACGSYVIPMTIACLAGALWVLQSKGSQGLRRIRALLVTFIIGLYCSCVGEHLLASYALIGFLSATRVDPRPLSLRDVLCQLRSPFVVVPMVAVATWALIAVLTSPTGLGSQDKSEANMPLVWSKVNPATLISLTYYQYRNLDMLEPLWGCPFAVWYWKDSQWVDFGIAALLFILFAATIRYRKQVVVEPCSVSDRSWRLLAIWCAANIGGISAIHMLNGGYAASSRHQYVPLIFFAAMIAVCTAWYRKGADFGFPHFLALSLVLTLTGTIATWAVIGANRYELKRHHALLDYLREHPQTSPIAVHFDPPLYHYWPTMGRTISHPLDAEWVINCGLTGPARVRISPTDGQPVVIRSSKAGQIRVDSQ